MNKLSIIFASCLATVVTQAQVVSSTDVVVGTGVIMTVNGELSNTGNFQSNGDLHLRKGLVNNGEMSLNGQVVMDGEGTQLIQSSNQIKAGTLVMSQMGKVILRSPMLVERQLILGDGILENNDQNVLSLADNVTVIGASNRSHVKGYVLKLGDDAFRFPVGNGSQLQPFSVSKPSTYDEIQVGYLSQNPAGLSSNRSLEIADFSSNSYWSVKGNSGAVPLQIAVASDDSRQQILQLKNNQWNLSPTASVNNTISSAVLLNEATYFTVGTQRSELNEKADVGVFPNPNNGSFEVRLKGFLPEEKIEFDIVDMTGKSFIKQGGQVKDLKMKYELGNEVNSGSYILRVRRTDKNQVFNQKLSINP
jgi:hypothetical protein